MNNSAFLGQLQSSLSERIEVWLHFGGSIEFKVIEPSSQAVKRITSGMTFSVDEIDNLQGLLLNARVRARAQL